jgi:hypothetical protein
MRWDILIFILLPFIAGGGAWCSKTLKYRKSNRAFIALPILGLLGGFLWAVVSRTTPMSLALATIIYDAIFGLAYFAMFLYLGETVTLIQGIGVLLILLGLGILSL